MTDWSDPTRAGFTPPASGATCLSASEVDAFCTKAARGAGLSWGLAEEAGFAARWLYRRGIDGPRALLARLEAGDLPPHAMDRDAACPIAAGAALSDFGRPGLNGAVIGPVLLLPFVHMIAQASGVAMALTWDGGRVDVAPDGAVTGDVAALEAADQANIAVTPASGTCGPRWSSDGFARVDGETLQRLDRFAMQTTVPASATSRADAGSAEDDND